MFCYFKAGSPLLYNGKLAGAQGIQRRLVGLGRNASAAIGSDLNLNFRERSAQHHGVADDADVGAVAVDDDLFDVIHSLVMGHQFVQNIAGQHVGTKGLFAHDVGDFRLGIVHGILQLGGKVPAVGALNAVLHRQVAALAGVQVFLGVGVLGKEHPVPGLGVGAGDLSQMGHISLSLGIDQRTGDKIFLHIHYNIKDDLFVFHNGLLLFCIGVIHSIAQPGQTVKSRPYAANRSAKACIINISSTSGMYGTPKLTTYCMAKWGVRGLTKALAQELKGTGIVVNTVCPTKVKTPLRRKAWRGLLPSCIKYVSKNLPSLVRKCYNTFVSPDGDQKECRKHRMEPQKKTTLTEGSVAKGMLLFALPIFISNLFQQLYNAADSLIVGNFLGGEALAAVGSSGSLIFLLTGFVNGVSLGAGVVVARYFGAKDWQRMRRTIHTTVALGLAAGAVLTVVGVLLTPQILRWMGTPDNVLVNSIAYFRMYFMGSIAVVMYNVGASILQSVGDSRSPMRYLIAASIINIVLDLVLIGVFRMGVGAAAFATIASQTVSAVLAFSKLIRSKEEWAVRPREVRFDGPSLKAVIVQGLPSGIQNSVISLANVIVQSNINSFGANAMAGCGAYSKVEGFAFLPVTCFAMALATFVSQNVGAGQPDRVRKGMKFGILCSIAMAEVVGVCIYLASPWLIGAFSSEPDVIAFGVQQAHTAALFYCLLAFSHCCAGILRGLGRPVVPMMVMLAVWCVLRITYITITLHFIHAIGVVFWAYPITWSISSLLFAWYIRHCPIPQLGGGAPH